MIGGTWKCHVCGRERDDADISVFSDAKPLITPGSKLRVNVRYCNDDERCIAGAPEVAQGWLGRVGFGGKS